MRQKLTANPILSLITLNVNTAGKAHFLRLDRKERTSYTALPTPNTLQIQLGHKEDSVSHQHQIREQKGYVSIRHSRMCRRILPGILPVISQ